MNENGAAYADRDMMRDSYQDVMKVLRANPVVAIPPDLLFVGRVMGLLNGLGKTLGTRTNLLVEMGRMMERGPEPEAPAAGGTGRRLLEA